MNLYDDDQTLWEQDRDNFKRDFMKKGPFIVLVVLISVLVSGVIGTGIYLALKGTAPQQMFVCADGRQVTDPSLCPGVTTTISPTGECAGGLYLDVTGGGKETITGTAIGVNAETFTADGAEVAGEVSVASAITTIADDVFPVKSAGYIMLGNDNFQSSTDRGTEYYYYKKPFTSACAPVNLGFVNLYAEGTPTFTCYDDGTVETTCNITMGTSVVDTTELKITVSSNAYLGMPKAGDGMLINYPLGVCFNVTTLADWDKIYPSPFASGYNDPVLGVENGKFDAPENISDTNIVGDCYVLDTGALRDPAGDGHARYHRFWVILDPTSDGTLDNTDDAIVFLVDVCWSKNDDMKWRLGMSDDSAEGTDKDCGLDTITHGRYNIAFE